MTTVQVVASISEVIKEKKKLKCPRSSLLSPGHRSTGIKMPILRCMARLENKQTKNSTTKQQQRTLGMKRQMCFQAEGNQGDSFSYLVLQEMCCFPGSTLLAGSVRFLCAPLRYFTIILVFFNLDSMYPGLIFIKYVLFESVHA